MSFYGGSTKLSPISQTLFSESGISRSLYNNTEVEGTALILQMRKGRCREVKWHRQGLSKAESGFLLQYSKLFYILSLLLADFSESMTSNLLVPMVCLNSKPMVLRLPHSPWKEYVSGECDPDKLGPKDAPLPESPQTSVYLTGTGKDTLSHIVTDFNTGQSSHCQHGDIRKEEEHSQIQSAPKIASFRQYLSHPHYHPTLAPALYALDVQVHFKPTPSPPTSFSMVPGPQTFWLSSLVSRPSFQQSLQPHFSQQMSCDQADREPPNIKEGGTLDSTNSTCSLWHVRKLRQQRRKVTCLASHSLPLCSCCSHTSLFLELFSLLGSLLSALWNISSVFPGPFYVPGTYQWLTAACCRCP